MFVNVSNHPSNRWSNEQLLEARAHAAPAGKVVDFPFPNVDPRASAEDISAHAENLANALIDEYGRSSVFLVQGESCFAFALTRRLHTRGCTVVAATSERTVVETVQPDGSTKKEAVFKFVQFREVRY